ncbi:stage II sporulation protein P [Bacillus sp. B1-b2]|uniref:stage II sporulation protein P n=1 Tax=Bacillus sp. B1-b2 TaxID=2653201 RepID=UPI001261A41D|nr:stage II sporulation protein P [Bacillus sp. B1-b2]KAB7667099.1 stage II sporulation protein P [Bacillus sp. B1-b2]
MRIDQDLFHHIKESSFMNPRDEFVKETEIMLRKAARKQNRRKKLKLASIASSGLLVCILTLFWIFSFNGKQFIYNTVSSYHSNQSQILTTTLDPQVYIYHSHNYESFLSETNSTSPRNASHPTKNITLVGERLKETLAKKDIQAQHETKDINAILLERGLSFQDSYSVTKELLENNLEKYPNIRMTFDIHRDSDTRSHTTVQIEDTDYAKIHFVISELNPNYQQNLTFAQTLHEKLQKKYPGISKVILTNSTNTTKSTYNQDVFNQAVLINIGGYDNTLEEEYRSVDALAEVIDEILKEEIK